MVLRERGFTLSVAMFVCLLLVIQIASAQATDYGLELYVTMAPEQIALDSGYVKRHVDSVVYLNPALDTPPPPAFGCSYCLYRRAAEEVET